MNKPLDVLVAPLAADETTVNKQIRVTAALRARLDYLSRRGSGGGWPETALTGRDAMEFADSVRRGVELEEGERANGRLGDLMKQFRHAGTADRSESIPAKFRTILRELLTLLDSGKGFCQLPVTALED